MKQSHTSTIHPIRPSSAASAEKRPIDALDASGDSRACIMRMSSVGEKSALTADFGLDIVRAALCSLSCVMRDADGNLRTRAHCPRLAHTYGCDHTQWSAWINVSAASWICAMLERSAIFFLLLNLDWTHRSRISVIAGSRWLWCSRRLLLYICNIAPTKLCWSFRVVDYGQWLCGSRGIYELLLIVDVDLVGLWKRNSTYL